MNAFAEGPFSGNPAAVCLLDSWLDDGLLRKVAAENNLFATAFLVPAEDGYQLRWFTTRCEIRLCGHATLAAGFVVLNMHEPGRNMVHFETRYGGPLTVRRDGELFAMDFPALIPKRLETRPDGLAQSLGLNVEPSEVLEVNETYIAVLENEDMVASAVPDFRHLEDLHPFAVAITAPSKRCRFRLTVFRPQLRSSRRSCDRLGALHSGPILVDSDSEKQTCTPGSSRIAAVNCGAKLRASGYC